MNTMTSRAIGTASAAPVIAAITATASVSGCHLGVGLCCRCLNHH
jgi:hypothetical protein